MSSTYRSLCTVRCFTFAAIWCSPYMFFFSHDTATTEIYTLSLHDALPISARRRPAGDDHPGLGRPGSCPRGRAAPGRAQRSEEHTSELQSLTNLVCRLLLEKKKNLKLTYQI